MEYKKTQRIEWFDSEHLAKEAKRLKDKSLLAVSLHNASESLDQLQKSLMYVEEAG